MDYFSEITDQQLFEIADHSRAIFAVASLSKSLYLKIHKQVSQFDIYQAISSACYNCTQDASSGYIEWVITICKLTDYDPMFNAIISRNIPLIRFLVDKIDMTDQTLAMALAVRSMDEQNGEFDQMFTPGNVPNSDDVDIEDKVAKNYLTYLKTEFGFAIKWELLGVVVNKATIGLLDCIISMGYVKTYDWAIAEGAHRTKDTLENAIYHGWEHMVGHLLPSYLDNLDEAYKYAAMYGNIGVMELLLHDYGIPISADVVNEVLLNGHVDVLKFILGTSEEGDDVFWPGENGSPDFITWDDLALNSQLGMMRYLITHKNTYRENNILRLKPWNECTIHFAALGKDTEKAIAIIKWLVEQGCPLKMQTGGNWGEKPFNLMYIAITRGMYDLIDWLIEKFGLDVKTWDWNELILITAVERDDDRMIGYICEDFLRSRCDLIDMVVKHKSKSVLNWLRLEYKTVDFTISEEEFSRTERLISLAKQL